MGADQFMVRASGKTAAIAFRNATEEARHESGHGGYSGTIAEKRDFVMIDVAPVIPAVVAALEAQRALLTVAAQKKLAARAETLSAKPWADRTDAERKEIAAMPYIPAQPRTAEQLATLRAEITQQLRVVKTKKGAPAAVASHLLDVNDRRIEDKWGPAGCVQVSAEEFIFFGWASS